MGITKDDTEEINKIELERIRDGLTPDEQHQWKMVRENLPTELVISYRSAISEACGYLIGYNKTLMPEDRKAMVENGCDIIRDRILKNPNFRA